MVIKEIAIMRQIGMHPNTLSCYDAYKDATSYYMIMELCTGGELFDLIVHKVSRLWTACEYNHGLCSRVICTTLQVLHVIVTV